MRFPGESPEYRSARDRLLQQEIELRRATEAVAAARRALPPGGEVPEDYVFEGVSEGAPTLLKLSDLFAPGRDSLGVYSFMYGARTKRPCPMCTSLLDGLEGVAEHIGQRVNLAVVAGAPLPRLLELATERGWRRLRLLSTAGNNYNRDYFGQTPEGSDTSMLNVFHRANGTVRHFWGSEIFRAPSDPGQDPRGIDSINPLWSFFDLVPEGRGTDWEPKLKY